MPSFLAEPFQQRALLELLLLAVACGPLGVWLVAFRQAYAAEATAHAMLPGLVVAALAGAPIVLGALGGVLVAAAAIAFASRDERIGPDLGIAVAVTTLFGLGSALALLPDTPARLQELLFGDLLGVSGGDLAAAGALAACVLVALAALHRRLALGAFDPRGRTALVRFAVPALLGVATVAAVQGLGNLLVLALLIAPGAAAYEVSRRVIPALVLAAAIAAGAGIAGLALSDYAGIAAGAAVALCAAGPFLVAQVSRRARVVLRHASEVDHRRPGGAGAGAGGAGAGS